MATSGHNQGSEELPAVKLQARITEELCRVKDLQRGESHCAAGDVRHRHRDQHLDVKTGQPACYGAPGEEPVQGSFDQPRHQDRKDSDHADTFQKLRKCDFHYIPSFILKVSPARPPSQPPPSTSNPPSPPRSGGPPSGSPSAGAAPAPSPRASSSGSKARPGGRRAGQAPSAPAP